MNNNNIEDNFTGHGISKIVEKLLKMNLISEDQIKVAFYEAKMARSKEKTIEQILVELGFVTQSTLAQVITSDSGTKQANLTEIEIDSQLLSMVPVEIIQKSKVIF